MEQLTRPANPAGDVHEIAPDLAYLRTVLVNVYFYGTPGSAAGGPGWVLIDTGVAGAATSIREAARGRFGDRPPACIILTHGHFDHVGTVAELAEEWNVPVFAHTLELPYLTGASSYPPPDPTVGGGMMARLSWAYPRGPIDLGSRVRALPADRSVPGMPGWRWVHSPGHTEGHVSLFRDADRTLIAGDAFITTDQESAFAVLLQRQEIHGPPKYYTQDWRKAAASVRRLALMQPELAATGHGVPLRGPGMLHALRELAVNFEAVAMPEHGRYVQEPAIAGRLGTLYVPPKPRRHTVRWLVPLAAAAVAGILIARARH